MGIYILLIFLPVIIITVVGGLLRFFVGLHVQLYPVVFLVSLPLFVFVIVSIFFTDKIFSELFKSNGGWVNMERATLWGKDTWISGIILFFAIFLGPGYAEGTLQGIYTSIQEIFSVWGTTIIDWWQNDVLRPQ
jgi:hypothetical protein